MAHWRKRDVLFRTHRLWALVSCSPTRTPIADTDTTGPAPHMAMLPTHLSMKKPCDERLLAYG